MPQITVFNVSTIELCNSYQSNGGQRRVRITAQQYVNDEVMPDITEITFFGNTGLLDQLPRSSDFVDHNTPKPPDKSQIDIEDFLPAVAAVALSEAQLTEIDAEAEAAQLPVEAHIPTASEEPDPNYVDRHA